MSRVWLNDRRTTPKVAAPAIFRQVAACRAASCRTKVELWLAPSGRAPWLAKVDKPAAGWTAYFVELTYPSPSPYPFKFTTEVSVIPDTLPYKWKDARPITAPDGK